MLCNMNHPKHKFNPCARQCVFIGHPPNHKGYKLYDLEDNTIFPSKDIVFHKTIFPFHETKLHSHFSLLPNLVLDLDHQSSTFPIILPNLQSTSPTSPSEPITKPISIEPFPEPMTTKCSAPNSSLDISVDQE